MKLDIKTNFMDNMIKAVAPQWAANRYQSRARMALAERSIGAVGYDQPGGNKRFMRGIHASPNSPDADMIPKKQGSVSISRDVWMNNPLAVAMLKRVKTSTVGTGLKLQCQIDYATLGISHDVAKTWQANTERLFDVWANSKDCDLTRQQNFYELQDLAFFSVLLSGDVCVMFPHKEIGTLSSPVRVKLIESDLLRTPYLTQQLNVNPLNIINGIEFDTDGAPVRYWFSNKYVGANYVQLQLEKFVSVDAFDKSNRRQVFHMFMKDRPGQSRGMPLLAPLINDLLKITKLKDSELTAHVVSSFFTVFVKDMSGFAAPMAEGFIPDVGTSNAEAGVVNTTEAAVGSGNIVYLDDDKEIQIASPRAMSSAFEDFYNSFVKELAGAIEIPFEQLLLHFSASYSASRGALLEGWKAVRVRRGWLSINFNQPAFQAWLDEGVASGRISAPGYFESEEIRHAWSRTTWTGMGNGQLDPLKETKAAVMRINNNLSNYEKEYNAIHDDADWDGNINSLASENALLESLDLDIKVSTTERIRTQEEPKPIDPNNPNQQN